MKAALQRLCPGDTQHEQAVVLPDFLRDSGVGCEGIVAKHDMGGRRSVFVMAHLRTATRRSQRRFGTSVAEVKQCRRGLARLRDQTSQARRKLAIGAVIGRDKQALHLD